MNIENNIAVSTQGALGMITLDRPTHLNALSLSMINGIRNQLDLWRDDANVQAVLINSNSPKAFCAGGDIRYLYDSYQAGNTDYQDYFAAEYSMLTAIRQFKKPILVFLDGYVLGGGFGLAQACHIIVSSEKSRFAMPETAIGFFPDVGATHFLSRLDDIGVYLAMSGEQISSSDALYLDLIDYHVPSERLVELQTAISKLPHLNKEQIEQTIARFITNPKESELMKLAEVIHAHFAYQTVKEIEQSLANENNPEHQAWTQKILGILQQRSLVAKQTSLKLQQVGRGLSLEQCMQLERDLQNIWFDHGDLMEGVRALIIDKDKQPKWQSHNPKLVQILENLTAFA
ncbi:enoyl-CoA hydratase/isomerase family protein [Acinetobacter sp. ANC 3832]|uniref:enoyl-CoA hydratase/isomerase family protein n=1 Tax=Acinetobacter sp. ANC 3832 TaxID=1977874 RepID=UPI000A332FAE|nr:enoyl-CoA hydratase/isomerase family protein [Acinetobacter sp. ANC 3832]OTG96545.1 enoyl-CoA hydratase [Acinetobacter sp. ANC 3832]